MPVTFPLSFRKATTLPVKVTPPMSTERMMVTAEVAWRTWAGVLLIPGSTRSSQNTERATRVDAPPPKPLKRATISGIEVIATFTAAMAPMRLPTTTPTRIQR